MASFGADRRCLMRTLQEQLDDPCAERLRPLRGLHRGPDSPTRSIPGWSSSPGVTCARGRSSWRSRRWRRTHRARCASSPEERRTEPGWALARFGDGGWWPAVQRGLETRHVRGRRSRSARRRRAGAVARLGVRGTVGPARRHARSARGPGGGGARRARGGAPGPGRSRVRRSARWPTRSSRRPTSEGHSRWSAGRRAGTGIVLDDRRISGWTLAMVGGQLRMAGAERVVPIALATLV